MQLIYKNNSIRFFTGYKDKGVNFCICNNLGTYSHRSHSSSFSLGIPNFSKCEASLHALQAFSTLPLGHFVLYNQGNSSEDQETSLRHPWDILETSSNILGWDLWSSVPPIKLSPGSVWCVAWPSLTTEPTYPGGIVPLSRAGHFTEAVFSITWSHCLQGNSRDNLPVYPDLNGVTFRVMLGVHQTSVCPL